MITFSVTNISLSHHLNHLNHLNKLNKISTV